jgi:hypothetical protein
MPMTTRTREKLHDLLERERIRPARVVHHHLGTTSWTWFVDDDDDRFVEVRDSARGEDFLVVRRDGRAAEARVVGSAEEVVALVLGMTKTFASKTLASETLASETLASGTTATASAGGRGR